MSRTRHFQNLDQNLLDQLAGRIAREVPPGTVIGLCGNLGAGKTTFVKAFCEALGIPRGSVTSPTFGLIHEYSNALSAYSRKVSIAHFDVYRLRNLAEFLELGPWEYLEMDWILLIEWADLVRSELPEQTIWIELQASSPESRDVRVLVPSLGSNADFLDRIGESIG